MEKMKAGWIGFLRDEADMWECCGDLVELGYRGVEGGEWLLKGDAAENLKQFHDLGLRVLTASIGLDALRAGDWAESVRHAHQLGADRVTVWSCAINKTFEDKPEYATYDEVMRDCEAMEKAAAAMKAEGIKLCYHNHYQDFLVLVRGVPCFDVLLLNTEQLRIELDVGWVTNGLEDPAKVIARAADRLEAIHVKDYINGKKREHLPGYDAIFTALGAGELRLYPALEAAQKCGVPWAVVEQDRLHILRTMETLTASYYCMKETGFVE